MLESRRFAVLGSGHGACAFCGQITGRGWPVAMWEPLEATADYQRLAAEKRMRLTGDIQVEGRLDLVTMDIEQAMRQAAVLVVVVPSFAHEPIFQKMIPHLQDGQHIVIVPGNFGGYRLKTMMSRAGVHRAVTISETASLPYACRRQSHDCVAVYKKKQQMKLATSPKQDNPSVVQLMNELFEGHVSFRPADSLLEVDCDNVNYTLHPFPALLSYAEIEKHPETFRHYMDGVTPLVSEQMMRMDEERLDIGRHLGIELMDALSQLKMYYGHNATRTIHEYVNSPESPYVDIAGHHVKSRYLTEDVPGLIVPVLHLARRAGIQAPLAEVVVKLSSALHDVDYFQAGTTLDKLGLEGMTPERIVDLGS